ncbi:unnamed protein product [Protopolystoma xenopodis]|uniref:Uncharacterized protein n=1 Tax=Protopolystoma xenopodis TaxID=117903 RepID=A0A448WTP8_9PLAT|nr:unnamed protein product [Protopolystoma xenopodis]
MELIRSHWPSLRGLLFATLHILPQITLLLLSFHLCTSLDRCTRLPLRPTSEPVVPSKLSHYSSQLK